MEATRAGMRCVDVRTPTVCIWSQPVIKSFPNLLKNYLVIQILLSGESYKGYMKSLCKVFIDKMASE